ncbi:MAG TPA: DUF2164 domain-containing protein [Lacunisphaera sp.]|nr:DUF2164 domain-containing protein [Lacunisphaera sp.]
MPLELTKEELEQVIPLLQRYFREEFDQELSEMKARFLLEYFQKEIAPLAYNRGVKDAEQYFRAKTEDLTGLCYEDPLTYWTRKKR